MNKTMRSGRQANHSATTGIVLAIIALVVFVNAGAQTQKWPDKQNFTAPSEEEFEPADGLVGLNTIGKTIYSDTVRIYDNEGSLWYEYSLDEKHPLYYKKNPNPNYKPFCVFEARQTCIRLKAISPNWYEVFVDEKNQQTKFMAIRDPFLMRETFESYIPFSHMVTFDRENNPLYEKPDGRIKNFAYKEEDLFSPRYTKGEWLKVEIRRKPKLVPREFGWIRWKRDREILIGFVLNCLECR